MMKLEEWDYWIHNINEIENLTVIEKEKSKKALMKLQQFFNKDVQALLESHHDFISYLINRVAWTRKWFVCFSDAIDNSKNQNNSEQVLANLKIPEKFYQALFELDIANRFISAGFNVEFYSITETKKVPDLKISNPATGETFYVEVSEQMQSIQAKEAIDTFDRISHTLFTVMPIGRRILHLGKIYKPLSEPHLQDILLKLPKIIKKCEQTGFEEFVENGVSFAFAKEENKIELKQWGDRHNVHSNLEGPSYDVDEIYRLSTKIQKEQEQLPKDHLNILVIRDTTLFFLFHRDFANTISRLEEQVYNHDHLAFCIILSTYAGSGQEESSIHGEHMYLHKTDDIVDREIIFLTNRYIKDKQITPNSISKIRHAFVEMKQFLI